MPVMNVKEILCIVFIKENHAKAKWVYEGLFFPQKKG